MDACLDTLSDELCQVNTRVGRIARWQARLSSFMESPSPFLVASEDEDDDGDSDDDDDDEVEDASFSGNNEMTAWVTYPLSCVMKRGSNFGYESSYVFRGRLSIGDKYFC